MLCDFIKRKGVHPAATDFEWLIAAMFCLISHQRFFLSHSFLQITFLHAPSVPERTTNNLLPEGKCWPRSSRISLAFQSVTTAHVDSVMCAHVPKSLMA